MKRKENKERLLRLLRREMNGAVAESMARRGIRYPVNYGVSAVTVRDIAARFAPDHALARDLYGTGRDAGVRELILAGLFIADPASVDAAELPFWEAGVINSEVAEYMAFALTGRSPVAWEAFVRWSDDAVSEAGAVPDSAGTSKADGAPLLRYCAAMTLSRVLTLKGDTSHWDMARVKSFIEASLTPGTDPLLRSAAQRLAERVAVVK